MVKNYLFENSAHLAFQLKSDTELKKTYWLFKMMKSPLLTRFGAILMTWLLKYRIKWVRRLIKRTIFNQFCGGETSIDCLPVIEKLQKIGVKSVLDYSVEGKSLEMDFEHAYLEMLSNVDLAAKTSALPFIVFKPTALGEISLYEKTSLLLPLNDDEKEAWRRIKLRFKKICQRAAEKKVRVLIDAEESWMQKAADDLSEEMMKEYNKNKCIIFNTIQMYRKDRMQYLKNIHQRALKGKFLIGFKLVRGAYMEKERARAKKMGYEDPIHADKESTDRDYNAALRYILERIDYISIFAGTHNEKSCQLLTELLKERQKHPSDSCIWLGQLYGMSDHITFVLGNLGYNVTKYLPYGPLQETLPYLIRRAEENTSVAGQSTRELRLIQNELRRRLIGTPQSIV